MNPDASQLFHSHPLGQVHEDAETTVLFGNRGSQVEALASAFPDYRLIVLKQTHSDVIVTSPFEGPTPEADGHITKERKVALCIRTADCVPVFIHDPETGFIAGIHAGWRGIENEIIRKTGKLLREKGSTLARAQAWLGPHIGDQSFEVGLDVAKQLEARFDAVRGCSSAATALLPHASPDKSYVSLIIIARAQLCSIGIEPERLKELAIDTFTSGEHESYRRDRQTGRSLRQHSFIALK